MNARPIYLDHQATTPTASSVVEAMLPYFHESFGNASSRTHAYGWDAEEAAESARATVTRAVGGHKTVFTSGATEALNLALRGRLEAELRSSGPRRRIITQPTEHKAVLDVVQDLAEAGAEIVWLPVDETGLVRAEDVADRLDSTTLLVCVMAANNEIGTLQPIRSVGAACADARVPLLVDGAQAAGKVRIDMARDGVHMLALSGHKMYGPKGVGALVLTRDAPPLRAQMLGGDHEDGLRSGTLNVPGVVGMAAAIQLCLAELDEEAERQANLRDVLWANLKQAIPNATLNGHPQARLPGNLNISFPGVEGEALLMSLKDVVAVSSGSACTSATVAPSHVLRAIGVSKALALSTLRFGLGRSTSEEDVLQAAGHVAAQVLRLRRMS